jgi:gas vesicle protein
MGRKEDGKMKLPLLLFLIGGLVAAAIVIKAREKKPEGLAKLRESVEDALGDVETRIEDLRDSAKRVSGDARKKLQDQAHELETKQRELRGQLDDIKSEAKRLVERARARV